MHDNACCRWKEWKKKINVHTVVSWSAKRAASEAAQAFIKFIFAADESTRLVDVVWNTLLLTVPSS